MIRPVVDEVHVSVTFTWDREEGRRLVEAWGQYYNKILLGGPAFANGAGEFTSGVYVRQGVTFTTRGCNNKCPWCLVPQREGRLRYLEIKPGHIVEDNNLLQADHQHISAVFEMLKKQPRAAILSGGLQASLIDDWVMDQLRGIRISQLFLAADTKEALKPLKKAISRLSWLPKRRRRCYVMIAYKGETLSEAEDRLKEVWQIGFVPFAQLYQPPDEYIEYPSEWKRLARTWSRPAAMYSLHKEEVEV